MPPVLYACFVNSLGYPEGLQWFFGERRLSGRIFKTRTVGWKLCQIPTFDGENSKKCRKTRFFFKVFVDNLEKVRIIILRMDTKKDCKIPECGSLAEFRKNKVVVGAKQLRKALDKGNAKMVCLARNADPAITEPIENRCRLQGIPLLWVGSMQELGSACGIDVGAAAAAAVD